MEWTRNPEIHASIRDVFKKFPMRTDPKTPTCRVRRRSLVYLRPIIKRSDAGRGSDVLQRTVDRNQGICTYVGYISLGCVAVVRSNEYKRRRIECSFQRSRSNDPNARRETERAKRRKSPSRSYLFSRWWNGIVFMLLE